MQAELILRIAADPNAVKDLETSELCELLAEAKPPQWVLEEAARRTGNEKVLAHLFSHPKANAVLLESALGYNTSLLDRLKHHINVFEREIELLDIFANVVPEVISTPLRTPRLECLLAEYLSPLCLKYLEFIDTEARFIQERRLPKANDGAACVFLEVDPLKLDIPRGYAPLARFVLLGDFLYCLAGEVKLNPRDLPVMAKVALALNVKQPLEPFLEDADVRVRLAAKERLSWNVN